MKKKIYIEILVAGAIVWVLSCIPGSDRAEDRALYDLLLTQAKYKCYKDITADSMIDLSAEYFSRGNDLRHAMLATYYSGNRHFDRKDYASAIKHYLKAEEMAEKLGDHHYIGLIDGSISEVYKKIYNRPSALAYMQKAYKEHCESEQEAHIISSLSYLILAHYDNKQLRRALELADSALALEAISRYPQYRLNIEFVKGYAQNSLHDYSGAIEILKKVSEEMADAPAHLYRNIGMAYYALGDTAKAEEWLGKIDPAKGDENFIPWEVYADRGDYREAFSSLKAEYREVDRRVSAILRDNVSRAGVEYNEEMARASEERAAAERRRTLFIVAAAVIAAIAGANRKSALRKRSRQAMQLCATSI